MSDAMIKESVDLGAHAPHRAERGRRLRHAVATSIMIKPLAVVIPLITVPLFLGYLGKERYGLFESIGAIGAWLALSDVGLALGLVNRLPECYVSGDQKLARRYISTQAVALAMIVIMLGA
jgi:O-antigen/teichoic acid export membrane protein